MDPNVITVYAFKIETWNDGSGNPRRGWLIYGEGDGALLGFADEGCDGRRALRRAQRTLEDEDGHGFTYRVVELGIVEVPAKEYRTALKHDKQF